MHAYRDETRSCAAEGGSISASTLSGLLDQPIPAPWGCPGRWLPSGHGNHHLAYRAGPWVARCCNSAWRMSGHLWRITWAVCSMSSLSTPAAPLVGLDPFPRQLQVLSRQRRFQQATCACRRMPCRPCVRVFTRRAAGFVADVRSRTASPSRCAHVIRSPWHPTHGLDITRVLVHSRLVRPFVLATPPFGFRRIALPRPLLTVRYGITVTLSGTRHR